MKIDRCSLFVFCWFAGFAMISAVSNPEISNGKSSKSTVTSQQQQQQQQKATQSRSQQEAHLNSINAYAANYETASAQQQQQQQQQQQHQQSTFNPSHSYSAPIYSSQPTTTKLSGVPELETNFQPMPVQSAAVTGGQSQPVIMQYLPQTQMHDGIQYLQLIPTRPLMVPISPYLSALSSQQVQPSTPPAAAAAYHQNTNVVDFVPRPILSSNHHAPHVYPFATASTDAPTFDPQTYAPNSLQNYRAYRINREVRDKNLPPNFTLNMYEYMPALNDSPSQHYVLRPRP